MSVFDDYVQEVIKQIKTIAKGEFSNLADALKADATDFINQSKDKLEGWTAAVAEGKLDRDGLELLVQNEKNLAVMRALTQTGLAAAKIQKLRSDIVQIVVGTAIDRFLPTP